MLVPTLRPFLSSAQLLSLLSSADGEEGRFFHQKFNALVNLIDSMPVTYEQDGKGDDAMVYLHYFSARCDWYITEKDIDGGVEQAFGRETNGSLPAMPRGM